MHTNSILEAKTSAISGFVEYKGKKVVSQNIKYPQFCVCAEYEENANVQRLCKKMNDFYGNAAKKLDGYCKTKLCKNAYAVMSKNGESKPFGAVMNYNISYSGQGFVSVVCDVSGFDGQRAYSERISHTWSVERQSILGCADIMDTSGKSRAFLKDYVCKTVHKNMNNPFFDYYANADKLAAKHFSQSNFYIVPKGIAFFINSGILCDIKYGAGVFVVPFAAADGIFKIAPMV